MTHSVTYPSIDEYINGFPPQTQEILETIRGIIHTVYPDVEETIRYDMPAFSIHGKQVVFFAGWKTYISLYPLPQGDSAFQEKIQPYIHEKSTVRFSLAKPMPYDLIREMVTFLIQERQE